MQFKPAQQIDQLFKQEPEIGHKNSHLSSTIEELQEKKGRKRQYRRFDPRSTPATNRRKVNMLSSLETSVNSTISLVLHALIVKLLTKR